MNGSQPGGSSPDDAVEMHELDLDEAFIRMGEIVDRLQKESDTDTKELAFELLDWVDGFHREAVVRIGALLPPDALEVLSQDPVVSRLFDTYLATDDDAPDLTESLEEALDELRPYLHSHGGEMEVLGVDGGVVRLRLMGSCHGCPSSTLTLTQGVEQILRERWPGFRAIEVEDLTEGAEVSAPEPKLHQIQSLRRQ
ncbi:MAG: NifU family protein [Actinomycetota bacterium]|nr:NifU family protein [Actinomycetota bacterium]